MWICSDVLCCTASIVHLVFIALDRYFVLTRPEMSYAQKNSHRRVALMIIASWLFSIAISVPARFYFGRRPQKRKRTSNHSEEMTRINDISLTHDCRINNSLEYTIISNVGAFYLPLALIVFVYIRIYLFARSRIRKRYFTKMLARNLHNSALTNMPRGMLLNNNNDVIIGSIRNRSFRCRQNGDIASSAPIELPTKTISLDRLYCDQFEFIDEENIDGSIYVSDQPQPQTSSPSNHTVKATAITSVPKKHSQTVFNRNNIIRSTGGSLDTSDQPQPQAPSSSNHVVKVTATPSVTKKHSQTVLNSKNVVRSAGGLDALRARKIQQKRERKAAVTLVVITGCFIICWLPYGVSNFVKAFCPPRLCGRSDSVVYSVFLWLGYGNSSLNPIIYTIFSPEFRSFFVKIFARFIKKV